VEGWVFYDACQKADIFAGKANAVFNTSICLDKDCSS